MPVAPLPLPLLHRARQLLDLGVKPDTSTFNCLLKACMRARDVRRAHMVLQWMGLTGVGADEITYNTLIKVQGQPGRACTCTQCKDAGEPVWHTQCDAAFATLPAARKQSVSSITHPLRQVHSYAGDFEGVLGVWRRMGAAGFAATAKLWGSLLVACSAAGQLEQAGIFWWEMKQLHAEGNASVITTDNVCAMMTACNGAGQVRLVRGARMERRRLGGAVGWWVAAVGAADTAGAWLVWHANQQLHLHILPRRSTSAAWLPSRRPRR